MPNRTRIVSNVLGLVGGLVGAYVGYWLFFWIRRQGFYALVVPGAMLGLGCGLLARHPSTARGIACAVAGLALGLFTEWKHAPFDKDASFSYLVSHAYLLKPLTLLMIGLGSVAAYWLGSDAGHGRSSRSSRIASTKPY